MGGDSVGEGGGHVISGQVAGGGQVVGGSVEEGGGHVLPMVYTCSVYIITAVFNKLTCVQY